MAVKFSKYSSTKGKRKDENKKIKNEVLVLYINKQKGKIKRLMTLYLFNFF